MILYHYTSGQGVFGILNTKKLYCSNVRFLNDPTEQYYFKEILEEVLKEDNKCKEIYEKLYNESFIDVILNPSDKFIVSFSKNRDSLSMWNYYAKGNGYNIGFKIDNIIGNKNNKKNDLFVFKVDILYDKSEQLALTKSFILSFENKCKTLEEIFNRSKNSLKDDEYNNYLLEEIPIIQEFNSGIFEFMMKFKHEAFRNEEEIRLIITQDVFNDSKRTKFKISENGIFIEYIDIEINIDEDIESITIHPFNGDLHKSSLESFLNNKIGYEKVKVYKSEIPFRLI